MKLWNKEDILNKKVEEFTVGDDRNSDIFLAKYDIIASIAHAKMLCKTKITVSYTHLTLPTKAYV